jgi:hypothetical protein
VLIVFRINRKNGHRPVLNAMVSAILGRIRMTDSIGWVDEDALGLLLPDTNAEGARVLAAELVERISLKAPCPEITLYQYPSGQLPEMFSTQANEGGRSLVTGV